MMKQFILVNYNGYQKIINTRNIIEVYPKPNDEKNSAILKIQMVDNVYIYELRNSFEEIKSQLIDIELT